MGTVSSVFGLKMVRLGLGLSEGPCPVGLASTINKLVPPKEKATATGVHIAATMFAPIIITAAGGVDRGYLGLAMGLFSPLRYRGLWRRSRGTCWLSQRPRKADLFRNANWKRLMPGVKPIKTPTAKIYYLPTASPGWIKLFGEKMAPIDTAKGLFTSKICLVTVWPIL